MSIESEYYNRLLDFAFKPTSKIKVATNFHSQVSQINRLLKNDKTALISTILEYMIHSATVDINFNTDNPTLSKVLNAWKKNLNADINIDIPRGLRSFTEQYFRERWKSSFIALNIVWEDVAGYKIPKTMYFMPGGCIYAKNPGQQLDTTTYYFGKPVKDSNENQLKNSEKKNYLIRKPYSQWYDVYPTPYLVRKGAIYHAEFKRQVLERQEEVVNTAFPYQFFLKVGSDEAIRKGLVPTKEELEKLAQDFQGKKSDFDSHGFAKGLTGAFPHDVKFEELIPDYYKVLRADLLKGTDRNLLSALGMIEFTGFSSNREEAILNPQVLIEEVKDGVLDYVELLNEVMILIKEKNQETHKTTINNEIRVMPGVIKAFITDEMKVLMRSWYDRGLISKKSGIENTTPLDFSVQLSERDLERKNNIDDRMYPPVTMNIEKDAPVADPEVEDVPDDKKKTTPESKNYKNATGEINCITKPFAKISDIPEDILTHIPKDKRNIFKLSFNLAFKQASTLDMDAKIKEKVSLEYAYNKIKDSKK